MLSLVLSPDQIYCMYSVALSKIRIWIPSLWKLEANHKMYWHVFSPIRLFKEVNYIFTPSQTVSLWIFGHENLRC